MTLQQTLEKLAVVAGDWCKVYKVGFTLGEEDFWFDEVEKDKNDQYMLFGAIYEKVGAEGWTWYITTENCDDYRFGIVTEQWLDKKTHEPKKKVFESYSDIDEGSPAHAAARALLAALEAKEQSNQQEQINE